MIYGEKFLKDTYTNDIITLEDIHRIIESDISFLNNISDNIINEANVKDAFKEALNKFTNLLAKLIHIVANFIGKIIPKFKQLLTKLEVKLLQAFSNGNFISDDKTGYLIWMIKYDKLNKDLLAPYQTIHKRIVENCEKYLSYRSDNNPDMIKNILNEFDQIIEDNKVIWDHYNNINEMKEYYDPISYHLNNPEEIKTLKSNIDKNNNICEKIYRMLFDFIKEDNKIIDKLKTYVGDETNKMDIILDDDRRDAFTILQIVKNDITRIKRILILLKTGYDTTLKALIMISKKSEQKEFQDRLEDLNKTTDNDFEIPLKHLN